MELYLTGTTFSCGAMALSNVESESDVVDLERGGGGVGGALIETFGWMSHKVSETTLFRGKFVSFAPQIYFTPTRLSNKCYKTH